MTPELFAEYRQGGEYDWCPLYFEHGCPECKENVETCVESEIFE